MDFFNIRQLTIDGGAVDSGETLILESGGTITIKPPFTAYTGSKLSAKIIDNPGAGAAAIAGANPWQVTLHSYDDEGRLSDKWIWTGDRRDWDTHLGYEYNRQGELIRLQIDVSGETLYQHYSYNQRGLLADVTLTNDGIAETEPAEITYSYTASGTVDQITYRGGTTLTNGYDIRDRLTDINDISSTSGLPFAAKYKYLKNSNIDWAEFWNPNITTTENLSSAHRKYTYDYSYDGLNRLTGADYKLDGSNPNAFDLPTVSYDAAGNIKSLQRRSQTGALVDNLTYQYENGNNQLSSLTEAAGSTSLSWDAEAGSFSYDDNGNVILMSGNPNVSGIIYDHRNLPVQIDLSGGTKQVANYNSDGQRILKEVVASSDTTWSFYIMDGDQNLGLIENGELKYLNILGNGVGGRVVASNGVVNATADKRFYLNDALGSVRAIVDQTGDVKENRDYSPWGLLMDERQYLKGGERPEGTLEKFTGKELDEQTGLFHFGARAYHPALGRWLNVDPKSDKYPSYSSYNYVANNPLLLIDPDGKEIKIEGDDELRKQVLNLLQQLTNDNLSLNKEGVLQIEQKDGKKKKFGTALIRELGAIGEDVNLFVIKRTKEYNRARADDIANAENGKGTGATIFFNPNQNKGAINVEGEDFIPLNIVLGHELIHAQSYNQGKRNPLPEFVIDWDRGREAVLTIEEINARTKENVLRQEQGVTPRALPFIITPVITPNKEK